MNGSSKGFYFIFDGVVMHVLGPETKENRKISIFFD